MPLSTCQAMCLSGSCYKKLKHVVIVVAAGRSVRHVALSALASLYACMDRQRSVRRRGACGGLEGFPKLEHKIAMSYHI